MGKLAIDGGEIYYEFSAGSKTPVVLAHGFGVSGRVWDETVAVLQARDYPVLTWDQRCCGASDKQFSKVSASDMADDLVALCHELDIQSPVLNGWSFGGAVVVDAASKIPAVSGLVLTGAASPRYTQAEGFPYGGQAEDVLGTVEALRADREAFLKGLYFEGVFTKPVDDSIKQKFFDIACEESPEGDDALGSLAVLDQREQMKSISCPALVVHGTDDGVVPVDIGRFASELLPDAELVEMPGVGHAPFVEEAEEYQRVLIDFLERINA